MKIIITKRDIILFAIIVAVALIRVLNNTSPNFEALANYSPVAAMALFGAAGFKGSIKAMIVSVLALLLSDFVLYETLYKNYSTSFLYEGWYWVYGAFVLMAMVGRLIIKSISVRSVATAVIAAVFIHWIVTDFGVWFGSTTYPQTLAGFWACLAAAIPFELRLLSATIIYSAVMFGLSSIITYRFSLGPVKE